MEPAAVQQPQIFCRKTRCEIGGCLYAPLKSCASAYQSLGDSPRTVKIDQKVVIYNPEHFQVVPAAKVDSFFYKLLGWQCIPLAPVDACVCAVGAIVRTGKTGGIHSPAAPAATLIRVEVREMIGLWRHIHEGFKRSLGSED